MKTNQIKCTYIGNVMYNDIYKRELYIYKHVAYNQNVYILQEKNQNLWGNPPLNICEGIFLRVARISHFGQRARFRLAIFRGSVYPRQSK